MLRSMFTAIGGLRNHQVMLDVTANNIANVNTVGYKAQRIAFESMMAQTMRGAAAPVQGVIGGSGPTEVGLGMTLNSIGSIMTQGSLQTTGQWSDVGLNGDGYFMVGTGLDASDLVQSTSQVQFTRAGNFTVDKDGYLTDQHGQFVLGLQAPAPPQTPPITFGTTLGALKLPPGASSISIDQNGVMSYNLNGTTQVAGKLQLAKFPNPAGLSRVGQNDLDDTANSGIFDPTDPTGATNGGNVIWGDANTQGLGSMASGTLEMSNVDLALEFTNMIVAQRGFQANTRVITTSDEVLQELVNLKR